MCKQLKPIYTEPQELVKFLWLVLKPTQVSVLSSFTACNQFDLLAKGVSNLVGTTFSAFPAIPVEPPEEKGFDWGILGNFLLGALAVVALVALTTLTGGVGTAMLFGAAVAVGTATVVMTVEDLVRGEARSVGEAVRTLMISAVCGAIGGVLPGGTLIANGMAGAIERAREAGVPIKINKTMRRILYGY